VFLKATKVDGVYDRDPVAHPGAAVRYERLSYRDCTDRELRVMDETAITLCKENGIPVVVFDGTLPGNIVAASLGERVGTVVAAGAGSTDEEDDEVEAGAPSALAAAAAAAAATAL
jgi:uridylate kinase